MRRATSRTAWCGPELGCRCFRAGFTLCGVFTDRDGAVAVRSPALVGLPEAGTRTARHLWGRRGSCLSSPATRGSWSPTQVVAHPHAQHRDIAAACNSVLLTDLHSSLGVVLPTRRDKPPSRPGAGRTWDGSSGCPALSPLCVGPAGRRAVPGRPMIKQRGDEPTAVPPVRPPVICRTDASPRDG